MDPRFFGLGLLLYPNLTHFSFRRFSLVFAAALFSPRHGVFFSILPLRCFFVFLFCCFFSLSPVSFGLFVCCLVGGADFPLSC